MATFEIWMEGYAVTGNMSGACKIGEAEGETFVEAVRNFRYPADIVREYDGAVIVHKGDALKLDVPHGVGEQHERPSIWACRLFDNEQDARKSFG